MDGTFSFGRFEVSATRRELWEAAAPVAIGARALDVLITLVRRPGELVTKSELIDAAWAGVAVEDNAIAAQVSALRRALGDGRGGVRYVQTVPGRGYRFVAPVTAGAATAFPPDVAASPPAVGPRRSPTPAVGLAATVALVFVLALGALVWRRDPPPPAPWSDQDPRMTFVIAPVAAPSDAPLGAYADQFARALGARFNPALGDARLAPTSGQGPTHARYAIDLEVRRAVGGVVTRVTLTQRADGAVLGVREVADALGPAPAAAAVWRASDMAKTTALRREAALSAAKAPSRRDARDLLFLALAAPQDRAHNAQAIAWLERAATLAPDQPLLSEALAGFLDQRATSGWSPNTTADLARVTALDERLLGANPENIVALQTLADAYLLRGRWEDARVCADRLLAVRPEDAFGLLTKGWAALALRDDAGAEAVVQRLPASQNARDAQPIAELTGLVRFHQGRWAEATDQLRRAVQLAPPDDLARPAFAGLRLYLAAAEAEQGHTAEARAALADFRAAAPQVSGPAAFARWNDAVRLPLIDPDRLAADLAPLGWRDSRPAPTNALGQAALRAPSRSRPDPGA